MSKTRDRVGWNLKVGMPRSVGEYIERIAAAWTISPQEILRQALRRGYDQIGTSARPIDWTPGPLAAMIPPGSNFDWHRILYLDDEWGRRVEDFAAHNHLDKAGAIRLLVIKGLPLLTGTAWSAENDGNDGEAGVTTPQPDAVAV